MGGEHSCTQKTSFFQRLRWEREIVKESLCCSSSIFKKNKKPIHFKITYF